MFSAEVFLIAIKFSIASAKSLLSFTSRTGMSYVAAGTTKHDRAEKDSIPIPFA